MTPYPMPIFSKMDWISLYKIFFMQVLAIWKLWLIVGLLILVRGVIYLYQYQRLSKAGMLEIDKMTGSEFEERLAILFKNLGYNVERTGRVGDYGLIW